MNSVSYLLKFDGSLVIYYDGKIKILSKDSPLLGKTLKCLKEHDWQSLEDVLNLSNAVVRYTNGKMSIVDDEVYYDGSPLHGALSTRVVELFNLGDFDMKPITNFLNNLMLNPSEKSKEQLYGFLDACDLPITEDGCFLAYKMVREDYADQHTCTFSNTVGSLVKMDRDEVDADENVTCSHGLHVASLGYITGNNYGSGCGARLMVCKVNPRDVVAVPIDYNNSKMRVCEYTVVDEINNPSLMPKNIISDHVNETPDYNDFFESEESDFDDEKWELEADDVDTVVDIYKEKTPKENESNKDHKPARVLTEQKVSDIWDLIVQGFSDKSIEQRLGVNRRTVYRVRNYEAYADFSNRVGQNEFAPKGAINPAFKTYGDYEQFLQDAVLASEKGFFKEWIHSYGVENDISIRVLKDAFDGKTYRKWASIFQNDNS